MKRPGITPRPSVSNQKLVHSRVSGSERHQHTIAMKKNQVLLTPEFRRWLLDNLPAAIADLGGFQELRRQSEADGDVIPDTHASAALKRSDPTVATWDAYLLKMGRFFWDLEVASCVKIVNFNPKKRHAKKSSSRPEKVE